ncbi:MAG: response regulator [Gloeomargaritaceae cyanobacterium C42_A2020_066]|nr:response regulator [Gloeomargaritaceae cyanobacterium C42_A2020_066]
MAAILVIEDVQTEAVVLTGYLRQAGFQVATATSAEEAKQAVSQAKFDLILMDVVLPGESGYEFCRALKKDPATANIPVIFCSSKASEMDRFWGMKQGAAAYLVKPVDQTELIQTVKVLTARA